MDYKARIDRLTQFQTYCVIPIVVLAVLPRSQAASQERAVYAALFRVAVSVLCLIGVIAIEVKKFNLRKAMKAEAAAAPPVADGVQYPRE
ncbi:hypothetical protein EON82_08495 [bacterium]|nr:MAG: hypothetical protein EON82_08495 [bacterium]